ncbi:MAG: antibiotic biosynthesis monooxygenase [Gammaproteobacteria bacterium]|nr:antibiotic biosynthesis monooxygenase [Gammaproteobacteria bacterium]
MKATVAVFGILRFPPENINDVLPHLREFVKATQELDGCILYEVAEDPFDKGLIRFSELWPDRASLEKHLIAPHIEPWREQARKYGLSERVFNSYDILSDAIPV